VCLLRLLMDGDFAHSPQTCCFIVQRFSRA
jgi:hypothetical protein